MKEMEKRFLARDYSGKKSLNLENYDFFDGDYKSYIIQIPCGKCIGCRLDYSRSWADRMTYHVFGKEDNSWFLTLTYDDYHIQDLDHNAVYDIYSLNYDHVRDGFIKRLRNKYRDCHIDFYLSGEYGDSSFRPHFHAILYNLPLDDLEFWKVNDQGDPLYTSDIIHSIWQRGFCSVSRFSWLGAAYTASYVEKKRDGRKLCEYTALDLAPEKCLCSRRPGIAYDYYFDHANDLWNNNGLSVSRSVNKSGHLGIPRYFRKLCEKTGVGQEAFLDYQFRQLERSNVLNPFKVDNSSFDLDNVANMLRFEEREVISRTVNKKI